LRDPRRADVSIGFGLGDLGRVPAEHPEPIMVELHQPQHPGGSQVADQPALELAGGEVGAGPADRYVRSDSATAPFGVLAAYQVGTTRPATS
jgi:hypothetical protein